MFSHHVIPQTEFSFWQLWLAVSQPQILPRWRMDWDQPCWEGLGVVHGSRWSLRFFPTQTKLWFYDLMIFWTNSNALLKIGLNRAMKILVRFWIFSEIKTPHLLLAICLTGWTALIVKTSVFLCSVGISCYHELCDLMQSSKDDTTNRYTIKLF